MLDDAMQSPDASGSAPDAPTATPAHVPSQPLVCGPWQRLDGDETRAASERLRALAAATGVDLAAVNALRKAAAAVPAAYAVPLRFWPGCVLVSLDVRHAVGELGTLDLVLGPGFEWCIDGNSTPIHQLNAGGALAPLDARRLGLDYLRFFVHAVRADDITFRLVERPADLAECGAADAERHAAGLAPLKMRWCDRTRTRLAAQCALLYQSHLYRGRFEVSRTGEVTMLEDTLLASDVAPRQRTDRWLRNVRAESRADAPPRDVVAGARS
jgi:hypothetical protein